MVGVNKPSSSVHGYASVHVTSFSCIHASTTGESARLNPSVWLSGLFDIVAHAILHEVWEAAVVCRSRAVKDVIKHLSSVMGFSRNLSGSHLVFTGDDGDQDENRRGAVDVQLGRLTWACIE